jgi:hypothetical protein
MRKSLAERDVTLAIPGFAPGGRASRPLRCPELYRRQGDRRFEALVLHWRKADPTAETLPFLPGTLFSILF